jgi:hypothetical protein
MTPDEARLAARRAMGSVALAKDLHRDARSFVWLEDITRDIRHAGRQLRRAPGFTAVAVLTLGARHRREYDVLHDRQCHLSEGTAHPLAGARPDDRVPRRAGGGRPAACPTPSSTRCGRRRKASSGLQRT